MTNVPSGTKLVGTQHPENPFTHDWDTNKSLNIVPSGLNTVSYGIGTGTGETRRVGVICKRREHVAKSRKQYENNYKEDHKWRTENQ